MIIASQRRFQTRKKKRVGVSRRHRADPLSPFSLGGAFRNSDNRGHRIGTVFACSDATSGEGAQPRFHPGLDSISQPATRREGALVAAVDFISPALEAAVGVMRSTVLNKLSHTGASGLVSAEVKAAIDTVEQVYAHGFPKI
jgi:hypothetical protein